MAINVKRPTGLVEFCTDLDLQSEWEGAQEALRTAQQKNNGMLVGNTYEAEADAVVAIEKAMEDSVLLFKLQAMSKKEWAEFEASHPPVDGILEDESFSVHLATFIDAVMPKSILAVNKKSDGSVVDFDPATEWAPLVDEMTDGQYRDFTIRVLGLNRGTTGVPFSRAASQLTKGSDTSSS